MNQEALEYAIKIIEAYQTELRALGLDKRGVCQGSIFTEALSDIENLKNKQTWVNVAPIVASHEKQKMVSAKLADRKKWRSKSSY